MLNLRKELIKEVISNGRFSNTVDECNLTNARTIMINLTWI